VHALRKNEPRLGAQFSALLERPAVLGFMRELMGDWLRLGPAAGRRVIQMSALSVFHS
jgi:hypothetical protein